MLDWTARWASVEVCTLLSATTILVYLDPEV